MTENENSGKKENKLIYPIFLPNSTERQQYSILNFRDTDNVDFTNISAAKIKRENNFKDFKSAYDIDVAPKFGEGSQFGKEQKDEARRKKYGIRARKYNPYDQPWILSMGTGKETKKFKGSKCKDLMDNASYFAFISDSDGTFTALPIDEWCDFKYIPKYKTLSIEEAEEEFSRRDKVHNKYAIMLNKRRKDETTDEAADASKAGGDNDGSNEDESDTEVKKTFEKGKKGKGKKKGGAGEDEGDMDEGTELDYITDESSDGDDKRNEEEDEDIDAMESEDEEEENKEEDQNNNNNNSKDSDSSDTSSDSDIDNDPHLPIVVNKNNNGAGKRSHAESSSSVPSKKQKMETPTSTPLPATTTLSPTSTKPLPAKQSDSSSGSSSSSLEMQVRRYLMRKPMTSKDLIHKLRKTSSTREQLMDDIVAVLMKINPTHTTANDKLYFTLKPTSNNEDEAKAND